MPATDGVDPRIQEFLDSFAEQTRTMVEDGELGPGDAAELLNRYQTVARERHDEIVALIPQMGIDDAIDEAEQRYAADNVDPRLQTLLTQFPGMRDEIISGKEEIIRHVDRGLTVQDALYEREIVRVGHDRTPGFREDVEAAFSAGLYKTRIEAAIDLNYARDAAWLGSPGNSTLTAPPEQPPAYQPDNANTARYAAGPGQDGQQSGNQPPPRRSERLRSLNTSVANTPQNSQQSSSRSGRGR
ncbi:hypothetical protein ACFZDK_53575 [Streptomyces sp. NPDC007901]|uniref:hypothetical protein n=1 Tax=Streptomyces sp. NPDC007901 TaxID=3364785 RepID=UPI0036E081A2